MEYYFLLVLVLIAATGYINASSSLKLYILCADYEKACEIVKNYKMDSTGYTIFPKAEEN